MFTQEHESQNYSPFLLQVCRLYSHSFIHLCHKHLSSSSPVSSSLCSGHWIDAGEREGGEETDKLTFSG